VSVRLSASDDWFSPTQSSLTIDERERFGITIHGDMLVAGVVNEGVLRLEPEDDEEWPAIEVPVRAVRLPIDVADDAIWTYVDFNNPRADNAFATIDLPESFGSVAGRGFTAERDLFNQVLVNSNGMIGLQADRVTDPVLCVEPADGLHPLQAWDEVEPEFMSCPIIALGWTDTGFFVTPGDAEDPFPGVYYRFGATEDVEWLEIVYWNHQLHAFSNGTRAYRMNSTKVLRLREDGTFSLAFPIANFAGLEAVGWFHSNGALSVPLVPSLSIESGDVFEYDVIPALPSE
jgi:hypothetical protein